MATSKATVEQPAEVDPTSVKYMMLHAGKGAPRIGGYEAIEMVVTSSTPLEQILPAEIFSTVANKLHRPERPRPLPGAKFKVILPKPVACSEVRAAPHTRILPGLTYRNKVTGKLIETDALTYAMYVDKGEFVDYAVALQIRLRYLVDKPGVYYVYNVERFLEQFEVFETDV